MRINKSIMAHRIYNFFHCYHGAAILIFLALLIAGGIFIAVNPFDIVWSDIFVSLKDETAKPNTDGSNLKLNEAVAFLSPHFSFFNEKPGTFEVICLGIVLIGLVAGVFCGLMRKVSECLVGFSVSFYTSSVFLLLTLQTVSGNFFEALIVIWVLAAAIFMILCHVILGGNLSDAFLRFLFSCILSVPAGIVGGVLAAFPSMLSPVDELNIYWLVKFICGAVMIVFALFHFDIMLKIFDELSESEHTDPLTDAINNMIGNEYIEGISGR